jgi:hypothetical protein
MQTKPHQRAMADHDRTDLANLDYDPAFVLLDRGRAA